MEPALLQAIAQCSTAPFQREALKKIRKAADAHSSKNYLILNEKKEGIERPILLSSGKRFMLMTHFGQGDRQIHQGKEKVMVCAVDLDTAEVKVIAFIRKDRCSSEKWEATLQEIFMMEKCKGVEGIIQMDFAYISSDEMFIVTEYCNGGGLGNLLIANVGEALNWEIILQIALDAALGLKNLHALGIVHRDIKPQNIFLIVKEGSLPRARIADLGSATEKNNPAGMAKFTGTSGWFSPEKAKVLVSGKPEKERIPDWVLATTDKGDVWALGTLFFILFQGGVLPWQQLSHKNEDARVVTVLSSNLFEGGVIEVIRNSALGPKIKPLMEGMLQVDPGKRFTAKQVYEYLLDKKKTAI